MGASQVATAPALARTHQSAITRNLRVAIYPARLFKTTDAAANLTALKKVSTWEQAAFVEKGGWAVMPGSKAVGDGVPQACAALLSSLK